MSTLRKRLESVEDRIELQRYRDLDRQTKDRSDQEMRFFIVHGYWPENAGDELPDRIEFTVRGIKTTITAQWEDEEGHHSLTDDPVQAEGLRQSERVVSL